jgi:hypothetical protein
MTLARLIETGSGSLSVRVVIEGLPVEFVSDPGMERTTADGRRRVHCLPAMGAGIVIEDKVNIPEATLDATGTSIRLWETDGQDVSRALFWRPDVERLIVATVASDDDFIELLDATGISEGDVVHVGTEAMLVDSVDTEENVLEVTRGYWNTIPQKHWSNEPSVGIAYRSLTNRPVRIRGRRVYVYLYGDGDDLQGDGGNNGEPVWRGHVKSEPACVPSDDGEWWRLSIGSIAERLETKLGGGLDVPTVPRGAYYHQYAALRISIQENAGAWSDPALKFTGFFESQADFCDELTMALATYASEHALACTYTAIELPDGTWTIEVTVNTGITEVALSIDSEQDGSTLSAFTSMVDQDGSPVEVLIVGGRIRPTWVPNVRGDERMIPRGCIGHGRREFHAPPGSGLSSWRLYVDRPVADDWTAVLVETSSTSYEAAVLAANTSDNWIQLQDFLVEAGTEDTILGPYGPFSLPTIQPIRYLATGTIADLRDALVAEGPEYANRGTAPFLTSEDLADWTSVANEAAAGKGWLLSRIYALATPIECSEVLSHEMRLYGVFPIINSDGKIAIKRVSMPNPSSIATTAIDEEISSVGWSSMSRSGQTINRWVLSLGYLPREDEWTRTIDVADMLSFAEDHQDRPVEVQPRSRSEAGDQYVTGEQVADAANATLALFGYPHDIVQVNVSWKLFPLTLGDFVSFSADHLPDYLTGTRPVSETVAIVIGRRWALGEMYGQLTLLVPWLNVAGYSPTARLLSQSNVSGNTWDLTLNPTLYAPSGHTVADFFAVGDAVLVRTFDEFGAVRNGTVVAVNTSTNVVRVTFTASWTPGSSTWELSYRNRSDVQESQKRFAFIASSSGLLGSDNPRVFGP